jgi:hypothetical protein
MTEPHERALVSVRASVKPGGGTKIFARSLGATLGKSWSFDIAEPALTGAETLLGILASDVVGTFLNIASRRRVVVDEVEATVKAELSGTLALLGVIGAAGEPHYSSFSLRAFAGSSAKEATLQEIWAEALHRAPLANTLRRSASFEAVLQVQP